MKLIRRMLILLLLATGFAVGQGLLQGLPDPTPKMDAWGLTVEAALEMEPVLWVDARTEQLFNQRHLEGALHMSHDDFDSGLSRLLQSWDPEMSIVVYCDGEGCESSQVLAAELREVLGEERVYWLIGGWAELKEVSNR
ncbi:MAG: rhodanese-like domain-containing protein [Puniceicoccaceae bacterium]